ncbi:hypothetical protein Tco_1463728, partial [Tanacetum coccineum]
MRTIQKAHDAALDDGVVLVKRCGYFFLNWSSRSHVNSGPLLEFHRTLTNGIRLRFNRLTSRPTISTGSSTKWSLSSKLSLKPTNVCNRESNNSKENTDDSLTQQPKTVVSPFMVDKDWRENFFHPANHVRIEEPKKARENIDAPIIEDWVSDDEEEVMSIPKVEKKAEIPIATKKESV